MRTLKIGNVELDNPYILAPMAGVTDLPFRLLCREQGAGLLCMEMVSAKAIQYNIKFDKNEILDVKWFTFEEILSMKGELRAYDWITNAVLAYVEKRISSIDIVKVIK